ncbi:hypothetical protein AALP_AA6G140400 [Arabis alpina]|uniref:KIB1-4 beta-propeller domain-containing protein n=1 Tax=Arabis alpina TaxID=50452 RepID=A0A087GP45_ARAAL|nr:hypothetical protein AALP_AA6G140400 [Arabis alpina]
MSCLPVRDKDWVVGVKCWGSRLSLCRPFGNRKWFNIEAMPESISPSSSIMFSKRHQKFYIPSPGGKRLCSLDHNFEKKVVQLEFTNIKFHQLPKSVIGELEDVSQCSRTDHSVESPTGELFLIKCYSEELDEYYDGTSLMHKTKQFMVFRAEEPGLYKKMIYTEDIGDLCIFVGHGEALCVPASSSPGLRPNYIYFVGYNFGVYDLTTKTCTTFFGENHEKKKELLRKLEFPYWPLPLPHN